jgi:MFS family permease
MFSESGPLAALSHHNYRLFYGGQCVSLIGTWIQRASQAWLVLILTDSPFLLGLVGAMQFVPVLILSLVAGVIIDRLPKRNVIIVTQIALGLQAFALSALVYTGKVAYWHVLALAMLQGVCTAFDNPARQSFVVELVGREHLMNAVSLNSAIFNGARIIGPALGGLTMDMFGPGLAFFLNGVSYLFVVGALFAIKMPKNVESQQRGRKLWPEIMEGLQYARKTPLIRNTLILVGTIGVFALNFSVLVPVLARDVLQQEATGYGVLMSFMGAGALLGALTMAFFSHRGPQVHIMFAGAIGLTALQIGMSFPMPYIAVGVLLFFAGWSQITYSATANSTLQVNTPNHLRGRVMSLYSLLHGGTAPFGNLFAGGVSSISGAQGGFLACGAMGLLMTLTVLAGTRRAGRGEKS